MHVRFDDKEFDKMSELVEGIPDLQVSDDEASEPIIISEPTEVSEPERTDNEASPEPEIDSDSEESVLPMNTFKYKSSHPEELI
ncbi:hypothetical protein A2U01_0076232, partial [Trifolium medium]|nr:hypothetical protein [Trifolium medium]